MEEIHLDYATLVSVYQNKMGDLIQQNIILESKNIILTKKLQELIEENSFGEITKEKPSSTKKTSSTDQTN